MCVCTSLARLLQIKLITRTSQTQAELVNDTRFDPIRCSARTSLSAECGNPAWPGKRYARLGKRRNALAVSNMQALPVNERKKEKLALLLISPDMYIHTQAARSRLRRARHLIIHCSSFLSARRRARRAFSFAPSFHSSPPSSSCADH